MYLDPEVIGATEVPELGFWLVHQVSHLLRQHAARSPVPSAVASDGPGASRSAGDRAWNLSGDAEIDDDLAAGRLTVPPDAVTPKRLGLVDGLTAEQYWDRLRPDAEPEPARGAPCDVPDCGSGCDGRPRSWDTDRPGLGAAAAKLVQRDVARRIQEHQRQRGDVPAGWNRWADEVLEPTVNWRRLLSAAVRRGMADVAGRVDFTYRKPSRRASSVPDVVLPSLRQPLPQVALVIDTSGSMSDGMLAQCLGEVSGVLRSLGVGRRSLRVVCCDAQAHEAQRVMKVSDVELLGGGGTDMGVGLARAAELRPRPDLVVVLTDGYTPWPEQPPKGIRVVVGLLDDQGSSPPWAQPVLVGDRGR